MLICLSLAACTHEGSASDAGVPVDGGITYAFVLDAGAFPPARWPSVVVYVPAGFRVEKPLHVVLWLHGDVNCALDVVRDADGECIADGGVRSAHHLGSQLDASGKNAILIVPELGFNLTADPGHLADPGGLRALLAETLANLGPAVGGATLDDLAPLVVAAHSGGHRALADVLTQGGLPVAEVWHLDSLYGEIPENVAWIESSLASFEGSPPVCRFADVYTQAWGTADNSHNMAETAVIDWLPDAGAVIDDRTLGPLPDEALRHGLVFKLSPLTHDDVARVWFERLLTTSRLPARGM